MDNIGSNKTNLHVITIDDTSATIHITGHFSFHARRNFESAYTPLLNNSNNIKNIIINFAKVEYIDSSALGMLLILRQHALANNISIHLSGTDGSTRQILDNACFAKLFTLS